MGILAWNYCQGRLLYCLIKRQWFVCQYNVGSGIWYVWKYWRGATYTYIITDTLSNGVILPFGNPAHKIRFPQHFWGFGKCRTKTMSRLPALKINVLSQQPDMWSLYSPWPSWPVMYTWQVWPAWSDSQNSGHSACPTWQAGMVWICCWRIISNIS